MNAHGKINVLSLESATKPSCIYGRHTCSESLETEFMHDSKTVAFILLLISISEVNDHIEYSSNFQFPTNCCGM